jgi:Flp pilus assembly protein TadB
VSGGLPWLLLFVVAGMTGGLMGYRWELRDRQKRRAKADLDRQVRSCLDSWHAGQQRYF